METDLVANGRLGELCDGSLGKIKDLARGTPAFLHVLSVSTEEKTGLVDESEFHEWMMGYMAEKSEVLRESSLFKSTIMQNSELAWRLCSLLISSLGITDKSTGDHSMPTSASPPLHTPPNK